MLSNVLKVASVGVLALAMTGCSSFWNNIDKSLDGLSSGNYHVTVWSAGVPVKEWHVKNSFVNSEEKSDGWFFYVDNKLVRVSGVVTIEEE